MLNINGAGSYTIMFQFLFQPDTIDGYEFNPIPINIHLGIIKILAEVILDDFGINTNAALSSLLYF